MSQNRVRVKWPLFLRSGTNNRFILYVVQRRNTTRDVGEVSVGAEKYFELRNIQHCHATRPWELVTSTVESRKGKVKSLFSNLDEDVRGSSYLQRSKSELQEEQRA